MKIAKILVNIVIVLFVIYVGIFVLWLLLGASCVQRWEVSECRDNTMSRVMWITHAPLIKLMISNYDK